MEVLTIIAILLGPTLAIQIQKKLDEYKEKGGRKLNIFRTLMATRAHRINYDHVQALNMIDLEFSDKKKNEKEILISWKIYLDHLNSAPSDDDPDYSIRFNSWIENGDTLFTKLLYAMSRYFGYEFDEVHLKKGIYSPRGHSELELEQVLVRKGIVNLFEGKASIPVEIIEPKKK